jgi:hypothetical protein
MEGFPVPTTIVQIDISELGAINLLPMPVSIKLGETCFMPDSEDHHAVRAITAEQVSTTTSLIFERGAEDVLVQRRIGDLGDDMLACPSTCDANGRSAGTSCGRKLVVYPTQVGNTAVFGKEKQHAVPLTILNEELNSTVGYERTGSLEVKGTRSNSKIPIVEAALGRCDVQREIATPRGTSIPPRTYWTGIGRTIDRANDSLKRRAARRLSIGFRAPAGALAAGAKKLEGSGRIADPIPAPCFIWSSITLLVSGEQANSSTDDSIARRLRQNGACASGQQKFNSEISTCLSSTL